MNQLGDAFEAAGYTPDDVTKLRTSPQLGALKQVLLGYAEIKLLEPVIDLDAAPFVPNDWKVEEHQKGGTFRWDPVKVKLYLSKLQSKGKYIGGHDLRKELAGQPVFNARLLDYLLAHPQLIPEEWKGKYIFFWGTIYHHSSGDLCVRYLCWGDGQWQWGYDWLGSDWSVDSPAALRAS